MTSLPKTMKAVALTGHGNIGMLHYGDYPLPQVAADEVLIEVHACGMNNTDVWVREGAYGTDDDPQAVASWRRGKPSLEFPRIQGTDTVGAIVAVGTRIDENRIGERVIVDFSIYNGDGESLTDIDYIGHGLAQGTLEHSSHGRYSFNPLLSALTLDSIENEQMRVRETEHNKLLQRYQNVKKELENQQNLERIRLEKQSIRPWTASRSQISTYRSSPGKKGSRMQAANHPASKPSHA